MRIQGKQIYTIIALFFIFILALYLRCLTWDSVFFNGKVFLIDPDSYYHMPRIVDSVRNPVNLLFDREMGYPYLYDKMVALIALLTGGAGMTEHEIEVIAAIFPAVIGALTTIPLFFIGRALFNETAGIWAAFILAITPLHITLTSLGYNDYHGTNVLLSLISFLFLLLALKKARESGTFFSKPILIFASIGGIFLGMEMLTWQGSYIYFLPIFLYVAFQLFIDIYNKRPVEYTGIAGSIFAFSSLIIVLPFYLINGWEINIPLSLGLALFLVFLGILILPKFKNRKIRIGIILCFIIFSLLVSIKLWEQYSDLFLKFSNYLQVSENLYIFELKPLFYPSGFFTFELAWEDFLFPFFLSLIGLGFLLRKILKKKDFGVELFVTLYFVDLFILVSYLVRFAIDFVPMMALFSGFLFSGIYYANIFKSKNKSNNKNILVLIILTMLLLSPNLVVLEKKNTNPYFSPVWMDSMVWMKNNIQSEGKVMNWWSYGYWINYYAKRQSVAYAYPNDATAKFFTENNETIATGIMDSNGAKYVIIFTPMRDYQGQYKNMILLSGKKFSDFFIIKDDTIEPTINYFNSTLARLYYADGNEINILSDTIPSLQHFRLIYESGDSQGKFNGNDIKGTKIYEYVNGTTIHGRAPEGKIGISTTIITNQGRTFEYVQTSYSNGNYSFTIPYSIDSHYQTNAGEYRISIGDMNKTITVNEGDVLDGNQIEFNIS
ncbi:MAG: glycosyltransferase family 39 protein [Candidatus Methanoperedens sp.]|nr:glycosyltransferase family 39 protein [Candidatus Methanoperedens sp.]